VPDGAAVGGTIYPVLFRIGSIEITSFGVMVALGAIVGARLLRRELARADLPEPGVDAALWGVLGGLFGAKLLWVAGHHAEASMLNLLLSRGGMSNSSRIVPGCRLGSRAWRQPS